MKNILVIVLAIIVAISGVLAYVNYRANIKLAQMVRDYEGRVAQMLLERESLDSAIQEATQIIAQKEQIIATTKESIAAKEKSIEALNAEIKKLQESEPSYPELESHPLIINLRAQNTKLQYALDLSIAAGKDRDIVISAQAIQIAEWRVKYESADKKFMSAENARIQCESILHQAIKAKKTGFWPSLARSLFSTDTLLKFGFGFTLGLLAD